MTAESNLLSKSFSLQNSRHKLPTWQQNICTNSGILPQMITVGNSAMEDTGDVYRNEVSKGITLTNDGGITALIVTAYEVISEGSNKRL